MAPPRGRITAVESRMPSRIGTMIIRSMVAMSATPMRWSRSARCAAAAVAARTRQDRTGRARMVLSREVMMVGDNLIVATRPE